MLLPLLKAIRPINLLVITLTYFVLYNLDISSRELTSQLELNHLYFLVISTLLIAAAGYLINDYYDKEIDVINKPNNNDSIKKENFIVGYVLLNSVALVLSYLHTDSFSFFLLFPVSIFILWLYSFKLKGIPFIGNLSIAFLSALVPLVYLISQQGIYHDCQTPFSEIKSIEITLVFTSLAFLSTLAREIIKDMEDIEGDSKFGLKTIPVRWGITIGKVVALFFLIFTLIELSTIILDYDYFGFTTSSIVLIGLAGFLPLLIAVSKTYLGKTKKDYKQAGNLIKASMFGFLAFIYIHALTL